MSRTLRPAGSLRAVAATTVVAASIALALTGCSNASSTSSFEGSWGSVGAGKPSLTISDDGSFNGSDGCNAMVGKGTVSGGTFHFGHFAMTSMMCVGVDIWLSKAATATVSGDTLTVASADGATIGTLDKR